MNVNSFCLHVNNLIRMIMYESHSVKKENESAETSLPEAAITQEPLIPDVTPVQERPTIQSQASYPPPPYFEPLPQVRPDYDRLNSAIYLTPMYSLQVGAQPTRLRCPHCSADILTKINYKSGCMTWSIAGSICAIGFVNTF